MKKALFLFLSLMACGPEAMQLPSEVSHSPTEERMTPSKIFGTGSNENVSWQCHQADFNPNLIWIECDFINVSSHSAEACIKVLISDTYNNKVDESRTICSNMMIPGGTYENYAAFENTKKDQRRSHLTEKCSLDTSWCQLSTKEFPREP